MNEIKNIYKQNVDKKVAHLHITNDNADSIDKITRCIKESAFENTSKTGAVFIKNNHGLIGNVSHLEIESLVY